MSTGAFLALTTSCNRVRSCKTMMLGAPGIAAEKSAAGIFQTGDTVSDAVEPLFRSIMNGMRGFDAGAAAKFSGAGAIDSVAPE